MFTRNKFESKVADALIPSGEIADDSRFDEFSEHESDAGEPSQNSSFLLNITKIDFWEIIWFMKLFRMSNFALTTVACF